MQKYILLTQKYFVLLLKQWVIYLGLLPTIYDFISVYLPSPFNSIQLNQFFTYIFILISFVLANISIFKYQENQIDELGEQVELLNNNTPSFTLSRINLIKINGSIESELEGQGRELTKDEKKYIDEVSILNQQLKDGVFCMNLSIEVLNSSDDNIKIRVFSSEINSFIKHINIPTVPEPYNYFSHTLFPVPQNRRDGDMKVFDHEAVFHFVERKNIKDFIFLPAWQTEEGIIFTSDKKEITIEVEITSSKLKVPCVITNTITTKDLPGIKISDFIEQRYEKYK